MTTIPNATTTTIPTTATATASPTTTAGAPPAQLLTHEIVRLKMQRSALLDVLSYLLAQTEVRTISGARECPYRCQPFALVHPADPADGAFPHARTCPLVQAEALLAALAGKAGASADESQDQEETEEKEDA